MNRLTQIKEVVRRDLFVSHLINRSHDLLLRRSFVQAVFRQGPLPQSNSCGFFNAFTKALLADVVLFQIFLYLHVAFIPLWIYYDILV